MFSKSGGIYSNVFVAPEVGRLSRTENSFCNQKVICSKLFSPLAANLGEAAAFRRRTRCNVLEEVPTFSIMTLIIKFRLLYFSFYFLEILLFQYPCQYCLNNLIMLKFSNHSSIQVLICLTE